MVEAVEVEVVRVDVGGGVMLSRRVRRPSVPGEAPAARTMLPGRGAAGEAKVGDGSPASGHETPSSGAKRTEGTPASDDETARTRATATDGGTASGTTRPPVVLLPGTGFTAHDWDHVAAALARTRTTHAVDLRGHGDSDRPGTYSIALMAADVIGLLEAMDLEGSGVDLVGHSLGGLVALLVAAQRPGLVRRLVLEDVGIPHPRPPATPTRPDGELDLDWAVVEQVRPEIDDPDPTWPDLVRAVVAPTLVVGGGPSSFVPQEHVRALAATVADGHLATLDTGHLVHTTAPTEYLAVVAAFLDT
jgi:pimeloyl-ACP methyl ester carboxylesterase